VRLWVLGSGSKGNAVLVESGDTRVLIDAGFQPRELEKRLSAIGVAPASIRACIITHEHGDHVCGAAAAVEKWGWNLHASEGTARACPALNDADVRTFEPGSTVAVGGIELRTVPTPHDAESPIAVVATATKSGARAGVCYDLGHATDVVRVAMREVDILVLESNHDEGMLRLGPYPPVVQRRISSRDGHLSNRAAGMLARQCVGPSLRHVVLAHLSEQCNEPELARTSMTTALAGSKFRGRVEVAPQHAVLGPITPYMRRCAPAAEQLSLF
jgi:phosphoribosyl 1,2-cyclic phosphodiesterase